MDTAENRLVHRFYRELVFTGTRLGACVGLYMDCTKDLLLDDELNVSASNSG